MEALKTGNFAGLWELLGLASFSLRHWPVDIMNFTMGRAKAQTPPRNVRILVVDDEEPVRKFVERVLRETGYDVSTACDGPEAVEVAAKMDALDVLVTDVMMPQMTGDELARRIRQTTSEVKVLYLTGFADKLFKEKVTLWEDEAYLDKPCSVKGLRQAVSLLHFGKIEKSGTTN